MQKPQLRPLGWHNPLEKEMATHSSIFAGRIPWTEEPGGLQSMGTELGTTEWLNNKNFSIKLSFYWTPCIYSYCRVHNTFLTYIPYCLSLLDYKDLTLLLFYL